MFRQMIFYPGHVYSYKHKPNKYTNESPWDKHATYHFRVLEVLEGWIKTERVFINADFIQHHLYEKPREQKIVDLLNRYNDIELCNLIKMGNTK